MLLEQELLVWTGVSRSNSSLASCLLFLLTSSSLELQDEVGGETESIVAPIVSSIFWLLKMRAKTPEKALFLWLPFVFKYDLNWDKFSAIKDELRPLFKFSALTKRTPILVSDVMSSLTTSSNFFKEIVREGGSSKTDSSGDEENSGENECLLSWWTEQEDEAEPLLILEMKEAATGTPIPVAVESLEERLDEDSEGGKHFLSFLINSKEDNERKT